VPIRRKPVELVYGKSGSGKTTWWLKLAIHFWKTQNLKTRVYHGMGGEETIYAAIDQGELPEDAIELLDYTPLPHANETCQMMVEGKLYDHDKNKWLSGPLDGIGLFVFEGLTPMANYLLRELANLAANGLGKFGQDTPIMYTSGQLKMGGNPPSHFGIVQRDILRYVEESRRLPGWIIWTAHEREAEDKETQEKLIGPDVAGKALTGKIGGSFGNTIHLDSASKKIKARDNISGKDIDVLVSERRAYFAEHFDPDAAVLKKYFANNRAFNPDRLPKIGYLTPPDPLKFYQLLQGAKDPATPITK
jgi:hypothetical protein